jgi:PKD repeat protein
MKRLFGHIRRHPGLFAGLAAIFLAASGTFAALADGSGHAKAHASGPSSGTQALAATQTASHTAFTALTRSERRPRVAARRRLGAPRRLGAARRLATGQRLATSHRVAPTVSHTSGGHGLRTPGPTSAALSLALKQATGLSPAQVANRDVCPATQTGQAQCAAEALVLRSNGTPVRPHVRSAATLGRVHPAVGTPVRPGTTTSTTPPQPDTPAYLEQAYDLSYLSQSEGSGDTIGIVDAYDDPTAQADLNKFRSTYGLPACGSGCFSKVNEWGNSAHLPAASSDWDVEISLDLDTVSAICPNCHILLVEASTSDSSDLERAMQTAATMGVNQISDSWTMTSSSAPTNFVPSNTTTVAATGDEGYVGAGEDNYPAGLAGVTAAGGTSLASASAASARGFSEGAWSGAGSGCDLNVTKPAWQTDTGCTGRSYADVSADADPSTGLEIYDDGSWQLVGGTSLATPLISSYYALTGVSSGSAQWAYADSGLLNDVTSGSNGTCAADISYICNAGPGYDGPTGVGSISGDVVAGAPGIGGPSIPSGSADTYTEATRSDGATITGGIYPNGLDTTWWIDYWTANGGTVQQTPATDIGSGATPAMVTGYLSHLSAHTSYDYELVAENSDGTTDGYTYSFTTSAASSTNPVASFTSTPTPTTPGSISFNAGGSTDSGASITDYSWDFGDGSSIDDAGATPTVAHQFASPGTYNVTLIVTNSDGQSETETQSVTVFTFSPSQPAPGQPVSFNASGPSHSFGTGDSYSWDFVGPAGPDSANFVATGASPTETLTRGTYQVTLTVTNGGGQTATSTQTFAVDDPPNASTVSFSPSQILITPNSSVNFTATASSPDAASGGSITGYSWNFGDGTTLTGTNADPAHTYASPGVYPVSLTVTDDLGQTYATPTQNITVDATPTAAFTSSPSQPDPGGQVTFDASSSSDSVGQITGYSWSFGDTSANGPGTSTLEDPTYSYENPGTYTVSLTVTNDAGQTDTITEPVTVDDPPTATLTPSTGLTTPGTTVSFSSTATSPATGGSIAQYSWNFGDGTTLTGTNADPAHTYLSPGIYTVTLTVTDNLGVTATAATHVTVDAAPTAAFTTSSNPATAGSAVGFNAGGSSDSVGTITAYSWNFGDGGTAVGQDPTHTFTSPGVYPVSLTVTNDAGESATQTGTITVGSVSSPPPPSTSTSTPAPAPVATPKPLTATLSAAKKQKLSAALAHGLRLSLAVSQGTKATFQITLPVLESKLAHSRKGKNAPIALLQTGAQTLGAGTHPITLKLSRAAARELASSGPLVLTVKVTLTEASGAKVTRSAKITLAR